LNHVQRLRTSAFADDDAVGTHAQGVADQIANGHFPNPFNVGGSGFQSDPVFMLELQLGGIFHRHQPFPWRDEVAQDIQHRRLSRTRSA
jgi:hypothetical protein